MELKMSVSGVESLIEKLKSAKDKIDEKIFEVVKKTTIKVSADAKKSMQTGGWFGGKRIRSKPGEPPYVQADEGIGGGLRANITFELPTLVKGKEITGRVGVRDIVPYARALEYGYAPRNLKERPFLRPALLKNKPAFESEIKNAIGSIK